MAVSSYGTSTKSSGQVQLLKDLDSGVEGRDVVIVEDIVDTGLTLTYLQDILRARSPRHCGPRASSASRRAGRLTSRWSTSASRSKTNSWLDTGWTMRSSTGTSRTSPSSATRTLPARPEDVVSQRIHVPGPDANPLQFFSDLARDYGDVAYLRWAASTCSSSATRGSFKRRARHAQPELPQEPRPRADQELLGEGLLTSEGAVASAAAPADAAGVSPRSHCRVRRDDDDRYADRVQQRLERRRDDGHRRAR